MLGNRRVLVTGGAGYIGSHTCKALARAGFVPVVYDNLSTGHTWAVKWGPLVVGDVANTTLLADTIRSHDVSAVVHFAGSSYVGESMRDPGLYFRNNTVSTLSLLDAMVQCSITILVFSSSCAVYGIPESTPIAEDYPQKPVSPYGESKLACENAIAWFGKAHRVRSVCLRYFNAAGADPDGQIGEWHEPETHLVPRTLRSALAGRPVEILGTDYATPDGTAVRDYVHVADLAEAHRAALEQLLSGMGSEVVNLGSGLGTSVRQLLSALAALSGYPVCEQPRPRRAGDPPVLVADHRKAKRLLGWLPQRSDLGTILRTALAWETSKHRAVTREELEP